MVDAHLSTPATSLHREVLWVTKTTTICSIVGYRQDGAHKAPTTNKQELMAVRNAYAQLALQLCQDSCISFSLVLFKPSEL